MNKEIYGWEVVFPRFQNRSVIVNNECKVIRGDTNMRRILESKSFDLLDAELKGITKMIPIYNKREVTNES